MSSVAVNNQFNVVLDIEDKKPQWLLSDSDQMRRLLVNLVQSAIRYSSEQVVQISVRVREDDSGHKLVMLKDDNRNKTAFANDSNPAPAERLESTPETAVVSQSCSGNSWKKLEFPPCTILIVDDLGETHLALAKILKPYNFGWIHIYNVEETLENVQRFLPDMILMDVCFPGSRQTEVIRKIRDWEERLFQTANELRQERHEPLLQTVEHIPIVAFSSYLDECQDKTLLESGCNDILHKPLSPELLVTTMGKWLAGWEDESDKTLLDVLPTNAPPYWEQKRRQWITQCEQMSDVMTFSEIEQFSDEVHEFGVQIHSNPLIHWADRLLNAVKRYDLSKTKSLLLQFCDLSVG